MGVLYFRMVSVVIVTWNMRAYLEACLASLNRQTCAPLEIIVVDNGSRDGTAQLLRCEYPNVRTLLFGRNEGYCRANNKGLAIAKGDVVLFLNADASLDSLAIERAERAFTESPRIAAVAPKILRLDRRTVDAAGQMLTRARRVEERGYGQRDAGQFDAPEDVFSACGAAAFWRTEAIADVSLNGEFFDEDFFAYWEDADVGWRAKQRGWRIVYRPDVMAYHARGGAFALKSKAVFSILEKSEEFQYHIVKNRYLTMIKNDSWQGVLRHLPFILAWEQMVKLFLITHPHVLLRLLDNIEVLVSRALARRRMLTAKPPHWKTAT